MHACKTARPNISKMQLYFRNMKYSQDCCHSNMPILQHCTAVVNKGILYFLNNCENNERISSFNEKIPNFLNVCGPYVIMRSVKFGTA